MTIVRRFGQISLLYLMFGPFAVTFSRQKSGYEMLTNPTWPIPWGFLSHFSRDLLVSHHLLRATCAVELFHRQFFPVGISARGSVASVDRNFDGVSADSIPVGNVSSENVLELFFGEASQVIGLVEDNAQGVQRDYRRAEDEPFCTSNRHLGWF